MKTKGFSTMIALVSVLICWLIPSSIFASVEVDGIFYDLNTSAKTAAVSSIPTNYTGTIDIPASFNYDGVTYSVTSIGESAFKRRKNLTSVTIPSSVTSIGDQAFRYCSGLTSLTISSGVESIGMFAFYECSSLTSLEIPGNVIGIGQCAFSGCTSLTSVEIKNGVPYIVGDMFSGCTALTSVTIPSSVTSIGVEAFCNCSSLASIEIPSSVTTIEEGAFDGCTGLNSICVDSDNPIFDSRDNCNAFIETASNTLLFGCRNTIIPSSVTSIGGSAFSGCTGLTSLTIPNSVTSIGGSAFSGCTGLTSLTIPNSVTSIESYAFRGCTGLTSLTIPNSVTSIGSGAFEGTAWYNNQPDGLVYAGNVAYKYKGEMPDGTSITIRNGTVSISDYTFYNCTGLTSVMIPGSVTSIESYAFYGCTGLTSLTIPNSVTSIESYAFYGCTGLTSLAIPNSVTSIGSGAFSGCTGLTSISVENEMPISIDNYVFEDVDKSICKLYVPAGSKTAYENAEGWKEFQNIVEYDTDISALDNAIYVDQIYGRVGRTMDIPVKVKNSYDFRGFQFTLELPEGATINSWKLCTNRLPSGATLSDKIATQKIDGNKIQVACSLNYGDATFTGNDGEIATVNVTFGEDMEVGEYPIYLTACDISDAGGTDNKLNDIKATLVLEDYVDGDANGDGEVLIGDVVAILNYIVGVTSDNFNEKAADANGDGEILIGDVIAVLNIIVGR